MIRMGSRFIGEGSQFIRVDSKVIKLVWADVDNYDDVEVLDEFHNGLTLSNRSH